MTYQEALDFLYSQLPMYQRVGAKAFKKDLTNTINLCNFLGNPQDQFKSVHIAGTNGKGSTAHMIASVLQEAGYTFGLYTSPHLKSFRERIRINGELLEEQFVPDFVDRVKDAIEEIQPSFFELTVAMAFEYFAQKQIDIAVIETGLGGRLDSTNVITPLLSVITSISLDHQDMLGNTITEIAGEKAGIIKKRVPVVIGELPDDAIQVMRNFAAEKQSMLIETKTSNRFAKIESSLSGKSLLANIDTVYHSVQTLKQSGFDITDDHFKEGIKKVVENTGLKGRWQIVKREPLVICDVGHNEEAVEEIVKQLDDTGYNKLHVVLGMVNDKSIDKVLSLFHKNATYYFCAAKVPRAMEAEKLQDIAKNAGLKGDTYPAVDKAYRAALEAAGKEDVVFVGGSTFVVAEIDDL